MAVKSRLSESRYKFTTQFYGLLTARVQTLVRPDGCEDVIYPKNTTTKPMPHDKKNYVPCLTLILTILTIDSANTHHGGATGRTTLNIFFSKFKQNDFKLIH